MRSLLLRLDLIRQTGKQSVPPGLYLGGGLLPVLLLDNGEGGGCEKLQLSLIRFIALACLRKNFTRLCMEWIFHLTACQSLLAKVYFRQIG